MIGKVLKFIICIAWAMIVVSAVTMISGCGPMTFAAQRSVEMNVKKGPPCVIEIKADGEVVSTVQGPKRCNVEVSND